MRQLQRNHHHHKGQRTMKQETIQNSLNDTRWTFDCLQRLRGMAGEIVLDQARIEQLGDKATDAQRGHWDNVRICRVPLNNAIGHLEAFYREMFTVCVTLKAGA